jgi:hypothetical protein
MQNRADEKTKECELESDSIHPPITRMEFNFRAGLFIFDPCPRFLIDQIMCQETRHLLSIQENFKGF